MDASRTPEGSGNDFSSGSPPGPDSPGAGDGVFPPLSAGSVFSPQPAAVAADSLAASEAQIIANGQDLNAEAQVKEHNRHQQFRGWLHLAATAIFMAIMVGLFWGVLAYTWHILMPEHWHYLTEKQLLVVERALLTALFSSALTGYVNKRMA